MQESSSGTNASWPGFWRSAAWLGAGVVALAVVAVASRSSGQPPEPQADTGAREIVGSQAALPVVEVYRDPGCGCCVSWAEHLQDHGFTVQTTESLELAALKASHNVPSRLHSCHTALVGGYVVEGHVPASDIQRLLRERPDVAGLAVPGMPIGSPGMEVPGRPVQPYEVVAFDRDGTVRVYARHGS